ncbi:MAG: PhoU domain-containing protein [Gammaproteobacteria bacterium]
MSHYERRLEKDLKQIRKGVRILAKQVGTALKNAIDALLSGDEDKAYSTVLGDTRINRVSREIDRLCHAFIARHLPSAGHLRLISSVLRSNIALERIGDYAVNISRESRQLSHPPEGSVRRNLASLSSEAQKVLNLAVEGFLNDSPETARATISMLSNLEPSMDGVYDELLADGSDRTAREMVALFAAFSLLKRVTDQAKNIWEQTLFAVSGESKEPRPYRVLFLDRSSGALSRIAAALAGKHYPDVCHFTSAAKMETKLPAKPIKKFMDEHGIDGSGIEVTPMEALKHDLPAFDVIISLQGPVRDYMTMIPFHASAFEWKITAPLEKGSDEEVNGRLEEIYRDLMPKLEELANTLAGSDF